MFDVLLYLGILATGTILALPLVATWRNINDTRGRLTGLRLNHGQRARRAW